jgi:hypothetical protein
MVATREEDCGEQGGHRSARHDRGHRLTSSTKSSPTNRSSPQSLSATPLPKGLPILPPSPQRAPSSKCAPSPGCGQQVDAAFARAGVTRRIAFELSTSDAVVRFVALGFGSALVPRSAATTRPDDVAVVELADPAAKHPISLVHRHPRRQHPAPAPSWPCSPPSECSCRRAISVDPMVNFRLVGMAEVTSWRETGM